MYVPLFCCYARIISFLKNVSHLLRLEVTAGCFRCLSLELLAGAICGVSCNSLEDVLNYLNSVVLVFNLCASAHIIVLVFFID